MGLHFGESSESQLSSVIARRLALGESGEDPSDSLGNLVYPDEFGAADLSLPMPIDDAPLDTSTMGLADTVHPWTPNDRDDLHKLGNMVTSFLEVPPFATDPKFFSANIISPFSKP